MTVTPAKLEANRRNARKSTGPKTVEGKKRSSRNATTHGIFCQHAVLPGECSKEFVIFRNAFLEDLHPRGVTEMMLVDRIVMAAWRLRRLNRVEALVNGTYLEGARKCVEKDGDGDAEESVLTRAERDDVLQGSFNADDSLALMMLDNGSRAFERLMRHTRQLELSMHRALRELEKIQKRTQSRAVPKDVEMLFGPEVVEDEATEETDVADQNEPKRGTGGSPVIGAEDTGEPPVPQTLAPLLIPPRFDSSSDRIDRRSGAIVTSVNPSS